LNATMPFWEPSPVPGTDADRSTGEPVRSAPVVTSSACRRCTQLPLSTPLLSTYNVSVTGSITGVEMTPTSGVMSVQPKPPVGPEGPKFFDQIAALALASSASNA